VLLASQRPGTSRAQMIISKLAGARCSMRAQIRKIGWSASNEKIDLARELPVTYRPRGHTLCIAPPRNAAAKDVAQSHPGLARRIVEVPAHDVERPIRLGLASTWTALPRPPNRPLPILGERQVAAVRHTS
jgi:hypothetical protein